MEKLRKAEKIGGDCFEQEERFRDNTNEWFIAGVIGIVHCVLPIVMSLVLWTIYECGQSSSFSIFNLPLPFLSQLKRFLCDIELYKLYANRNEETEKDFETKKMSILNQISSHEHIVNMSLILEASLESSFQFFFQTTYQLPRIILAFTTTGFKIEELFTWKLFSIVMSFVSFSMAFNKIR